MTNTVTAIGSRARTPARNVRKMRPKRPIPRRAPPQFGRQSFAARLPRVNRFGEASWLARALELIGGGDLAQEILHRMAELLGLTPKIA